MEEQPVASVRAAIGATGPGRDLGGQAISMIREVVFRRQEGRGREGMTYKYMFHRANSIH